ncbi:MAG: hypothetical protein HOE86_14995 [Gemmatimonadetes bacterium]|nr:hypothetical protein [Gemmatimonadota bacterium]
MMATEKLVKTFAWPTTEPDAPSQPQAASSAKVAQALGVDPLLPPTATTRREAKLPEGIGADSTHAFVWNHASAAAAVVRSLIRGDHFPSPDDVVAGMSSRQIAAAFMAGLGLEVGARVMRHLHRDEEARWVGQAVVEEPLVSHRVALAVMQAVRVRVETGDYLEDGGKDYAVRLLEGAFYRGRVARLLRPSGQSGFHAIKNASAEQIAPYISHEHPQTIALCLSQVDPGMGARILAQFPERLQADVAYRMSTLEDVTPEAMQELETALETSLGDILSGNLGVGGPKVVADLLNMSGASVESNVLNQFDGQSEMGDVVRNLMFVFTDIAKMADHDLETVLKKVDPKDLRWLSSPAIRRCGSDFSAIFPTRPEHWSPRSWRI